MEGIWNRSLIWLCCTALLLGRQADSLVVVVMLAAVTVSALTGYLNSTSVPVISSLAFAALGNLWPPFCFFMPLVHYDLFLPRRCWRVLAIIPSIIICFVSLPPGTAAVLVALMALSALLKMRTDELGLARVELTGVRDSGRELSLRLEQKNRDLLEKQDYEVRLATLNERNRIAREIHDQVGHLLSRSILQVGALLVAQPDPGTREQLSSVRNTLSQAMDSIRASVHDLHEESVDLRMQLSSLAESFLFCPVQLDYRLETEPEKQISYCFIALVKEGLNNITRHSNATRVTLTVSEHPALFQLVLQDNGTNLVGGMTGGLGISNMTDRVQALGGQILIEHRNGFRIFVSVPRRRPGCESADRG